MKHSNPFENFQTHNLKHDVSPRIAVFANVNKAHNAIKSEDERSVIVIDSLIKHAMNEISAQTDSGIRADPIITLHLVGSNFRIFYLKFLFIF